MSADIQTYISVATLVLSAFAAIGHLFAKNTIAYKAADSAAKIETSLGGGK